MDRFVKYRYLVVLAQAGNYSTAAHELGVSQPALSRAIQALEQSVGARLVDRSGKHATLSPLGELVYQRAQRILRELDDLEYEIEQAQGAEAGHLALGAGPYPSVLVMPRLMASLAQLYPRLQVKCEMEGWRLLVARLKHRQLDLVVAEASEAEADLELKVHLLRQRTAILCVRRDHPLVGRPVSREALTQYPFATSSLPNRVLATLQGAFGIRWRPAVQCDDVRLLLAFAKRTDSITFASQGMIASDPDLAALDYADAPVESRFGIIHLSNRTLSPVARKVIELLMQEDPRGE